MKLSRSTTKVVTVALALLLAVLAAIAVFAPRSWSAPASDATSALRSAGWTWTASWSSHS